MTLLFYHPKLWRQNNKTMLTANHFLISGQSILQERTE